MAVDPSELEVAFVADWDGDWEIYFVRSDGSGLFQLSRNSTDDSDPVWSPDGRQVAHVADIAGEPRVHVADVEGVADRDLAPPHPATSGVVWSPDGQSIMFRSIDDLYSVGIRTGNPTRLVSFPEFGPGLPSFSPDGGRMVIPTSMRAGIPNQGVVVANADGSDMTELSFPQGDVSWPTWHPYRDLILFEGFTQTDGSGLYTTNLASTLTELNVDHELRPSLPAWSPDGSMIAYLAWDSPPRIGGPARHSIRVITDDSSVDLAVIRPPEDPEPELNIATYAWGPDSRHFAYTVRIASAGNVTLNLAVLDICSGTSVTVAEDIASQFSFPSWRPLP